VQALAALAVKRDGGVTEDVVDEIVHGRLLEGAPLAGDAVEASGALDLFREEVVDVCNVSGMLILLQKNNSLTLPSSPQRKRPGTQAHSISSQL
jgi:hypothetical protein